MSATTPATRSASAFDVARRILNPEHARLSAPYATGEHLYASDGRRLFWTRTPLHCPPNAAGADRLFPLADVEHLRVLTEVAAPLFLRRPSIDHLLANIDGVAPIAKREVACEAEDCDRGRLGGCVAHGEQYAGCADCEKRPVCLTCRGTRKMTIQGRERAVRLHDAPLYFRSCEDPCVCNEVCYIDPTYVVDGLGMLRDLGAGEAEVRRVDAAKPPEAKAPKKKQRKLRDAAAAKTVWFPPIAFVAAEVEAVYLLMPRSEP